MSCKFVKDSIGTPADIDPVGEIPEFRDPVGNIEFAKYEDIFE
jgi:hypothetical protein